jgi:hypothetical protein
MRQMRVLFALLLAVAGCRASAPPLAVDSAYGVVRAKDESAASDASRALDRLVPRVLAVLPGVEERPIEVWLQRELMIWRGAPFPDHVAGMAEFEHGRIYLRDEDAELELHLAHELVHLMLGPEWDTLPAVLEEGLCDHVAHEIAGDSRSALRVWRLLEAAGAFGGVDARVEFRLPGQDRRRGNSQVHEVRLGAGDPSASSLSAIVALDDSAVFRESTADAGGGLYGVGYFLIERIVTRRGYDGVLELCRDAARAGKPRVALDAILAAAELTDDREALRLAAGAELSAHDLPVIAPLCARTLAELLVEIARPHYPEHEAIPFLRAARVSIALANSRARLPLLASSGFVSALVERWDR